MAYVEERHAPLFHMITTSSTARKRMVPILVEEGGVVCDSTVILKYLDERLDGPKKLFPEASEGAELARDVRELEELYDRKLGAATRGWAYSWVLEDPSLFVDLLDVELPRWEHLAFRATAPVVRRLMMRVFPTDEATRAKRLGEVRELFEGVGKRLADGRRYLTGARFTAADLTFASLAAPALLPPEYGTPMPDIARVPAARRSELDGLRAMPAGAFVMRLFREDRHTRA